MLEKLWFHCCVLSIFFICVASLLSVVAVLPSWRNLNYFISWLCILMFHFLLFLTLHEFIISVFLTFAFNVRCFDVSDRHSTSSIYPPPSLTHTYGLWFGDGTVSNFPGLRLPHIGCQFIQCQYNQPKLNLYIKVWYGWPVPE